MKKNKGIIIVLSIIILIILLIVLFSYYQEEKENYRGYADFTMGSEVMLLSYNKNLDLQFSEIRIIQARSTQKKITEGYIIYNYAQYGYVPILNYLKQQSESEDLIYAFSELTDFYVKFNGVTYDSREDIFVIQDNGYYYTYEDGIYTYYVSKEVITKKEMNRIYNEYLESINQSDALNNLATLLYKDSAIKKEYSYKELINEIKNNYETFYNDYEDEIILAISSDLSNFVEYLFTYYIWVDDAEVNRQPSVLLQDIATETLDLTYSFTRLDRIYNTASKYYKYNYQLDLQSIWNTLEEKGYPMFYM